ncbi:MAG: putative cytokinetic ring protein SteA [Actinomycetota bacterium]|nr:putative cytokinetic ring protein SteA [Actinomycetota bacterium]
MALSRTTRQRSRTGGGRAGLDGGPDGPTGISGTARLGRRTKRLTPRLHPGDVAVIDHRDIDRVSADDLVASGVRCVLNVARSSSGRYPNQGPLILTQAGVHLVDLPGAALFDALRDGDRITVRGGVVERDGRVLARGEALDTEAVARAHEAARREIGAALEAFAENTVAHMRDEHNLLAGRIDLPELRTPFRDRPALVVVRGVDHQRDLRILRPYLRDTKPVLVGVDGGADAILDDGFVPDIVVGDMDSASDRALGCGAELVVHAYPDGRAPGRERLDRLGLDYRIVPAPGTSQDVAMLIAAEKGAALIVSVGSHFNLMEFLDKNRRGMASTFLTRLRIGEILVDAKGVSRLYRPSPGVRPLALLVLAGLATLALVLYVSPDVGRFLDLLWLKLQILLGLE